MHKVYVQADFPKPTTPSSKLEELSDTEMRNLLLAHTIAGDRQMRELAEQRSLAVRDYLSRQLKIAQSRLFLRVGQSSKQPEHPVQSEARVEFTPASQK